MSQYSYLAAIKILNRPVFTTNELAMLSGKSLSATTQALNLMQKEELVFKIYRGIWAKAGDKNLSAYTAIPYVLGNCRAYVSFISALHLYGIIEQIPQEITLASTAHTNRIITSIGTFSIHRISPSFFKGFDWYKETGSFLIAEPEKALIDCLYVSAYKKKQFTYFPELDIPKSFKYKKAKEWAKSIFDRKASSYVLQRLSLILDKA